MPRRRPASRRPASRRPAVRRLAAPLLAAIVLVTGLASCAEEADEGLPLGPGGERAEGAVEATGRLTGGTEWRLRAPDPDDWNGTLLLYSRGSVPPEEDNVALDAPDETTAGLLLDQGFAMIGSSYREPGWALGTAVEDQLRLLGVATEELGEPDRVVAWGHSLGGLVTVALAEQHPDEVDGALAACGIVGGPDLLWDPFLDVSFVLRTLLVEPGRRVQLAGFTTPPALALQQLRNAGQDAFETPEGRARVALAAAVAGVPGRVRTPTSPTAGDLAAELSAQATNLAFVLPMTTTFRADMERHVGGNPSSDVGVDHAALLAASPSRDLVEAAYAAAGLDLAADLALLAATPRIEADPAARERLLAPADPTGELSVPTLLLHATADSLAFPSHARDYADKVQAAGRSDLLRTAAVARSGHCLFTAAEQVAALAALLERVEQGSWPDLSAGGLSAAATAFGPDANVQTAPDGTTTPTRPAFVPPDFPRAPRTAAGAPP